MSDRCQSERRQPMTDQRYQELMQRFGGRRVEDKVADVCRHGVALDVHCCGCHSGFIFDPEHECSEEPA